MRLAALAVLLLLGACAAAPMDPGVLALPGTGKSLAEFNADDIECRKLASTAPGGASGTWADQQRRYDFAYIQCMYAKGHRVPVPGQYTGAPASGPPPPPPPGSKPQPPAPQ
jgi:hypothetical protein